MSEEKETEQQASEEKTKKPFKRFIFMGVAVILLIVGGFIIYDVIHYQSTDDAYVETTTVQVAPKVSGEVVAVYITDNQFVNKEILLRKLMMPTTKSNSLKLKQDTKELC